MTEESLSCKSMLAWEKFGNWTEMGLNDCSIIM